MNDEDEVVTRLTRAVRAADAVFESSGGSTRHYVRDCLLHELANERLSFVDVNVSGNKEKAQKYEDTLRRLLELYDDRHRTIGAVLTFVHTEVRGLFDLTCAQCVDAMRTEPQRQHHQHCGCSVCTMKG